jgi:hypothetical protein
MAPSPLFCPPAWRTPAVGVVHSVWTPAGPQQLERFLASYRRHPAGMDHELVLAWNGVAGPEDLGAFAAVVAGVEHRAVFLPDAPPDLRTYFTAARECRARHLAFLNAGSEILADGWLASMYAAAQTPGVGLVGATGSFESVANDYPAGWFAPFPNPHIRTNAFMIERSLLFDLEIEDLTDKLQCLRFESGAGGLTAQILARGLRPVVVDRAGVAHDMTAWPHSATFRSGGQSGLLVADNRTRDWDAGDAAFRDWLSSLSWGAAAGRAAA